MNTEVAKLLYDNRVLLHNLLVQDADKWENLAKQETENKQVCLDYAKFRRDLAAQIKI